MSELALYPEKLTVVLIPGFMLDESLWDEVVNELPATWNIIRANLLQGTTIAEIAQNIVQQTAEKFLLIGFSLGGYIARSIAEQFPERVTGLILIASSLRADTAQQREHKLTAIRLSSADKFRGLSSLSIIKTLAPRHATNTALIKRIQLMGKNMGYAVFIHQSMLDRSRYDMDKITCPILIIAAAQDQLRTAEEAQELFEQSQQACLVTIEDTGHMIPLEQPQKLVEVIMDWLD